MQHLSLGDLAACRCSKAIQHMHYNVTHLKTASAASAATAHVSMESMSMMKTGPRVEMYLQACDRKCRQYQMMTRLEENGLHPSMWCAQHAHSSQMFDFLSSSIRYDLQADPMLAVACAAAWLDLNCCRQPVMMPNSSETRSPLCHLRRQNCTTCSPVVMGWRPALVVP